MTLTKLNFRPGIMKEQTSYASEGGWIDGNRVRFRTGQPETIGGWQKYSQSQPSVSHPPYSGSVDGAARALHPWEATDGSKYLGVASERRMYVETGGNFFDITPVRASGTLGSNPFSTANGSPVVTVTHTGHGLNDQDIAIFSGASAVAGITVSGEYVITLVDSNTYKITATSNASSSTTGGGASVAYTYLLGVGLSASTAGLGWGTGTWGTGTWGTQRTATTGVLLSLRTWTIDNWVDDGIFCPSNGAIYKWVKANGTSTRAVQISQAPFINSTFVITKDRFLIALGCSDPGAGTNFDPLSIKWCSQGDYTTWTPSSTNTAGFYRLNSGKRIVSGQVVRNDVLVWTDQDLFVMQPLEPPLVFGFEQVGTNCGAVSQNAVAVQNGVAYWMGYDQFYRYAGNAPEPLPCSVLRYVFDNLNYSQADKFFAGISAGYNEVWFFYCSSSSTEIDSYVSYNYVDGIWNIGKLSRTAWIDRAQLPKPVAAAPNGYLYVHEIGETDDGSPMGDYLVSALTDVGDGDSLTFVDRVIPDFTFYNSSTSIRLSLIGTQYIESAESITKGPYTVNSSTSKIDMRLRARQITMRIDGVNGKWQLGATRVNIKTDGRR